MLMTNEEYQKVRNAFIPFAEAYANAKVDAAKYKIKEGYRREWDKCFIKKMDELAMKAGLIWKK